MSIHRRTACWFAFLVVSVAVPALAQAPPMPATDLSLGYQSLHIPGQNYPFGVGVGVSRAVTDMVRVVGEAGVSIDQQSGSNLNGTLTFYQYGVGPRIHADLVELQPDPGARRRRALAGGSHDPGGRAVQRLQQRVHAAAWRRRHRADDQDVRGSGRRQLPASLLQRRH